MLLPQAVFLFLVGGVAVPAAAAAAAVTATAALFQQRATVTYHTGPATTSVAATAVKRYYRSNSTSAGAGNLNIQKAQDFPCDGGTCPGEGTCCHGAKPCCPDYVDAVCCSDGCCPSGTQCCGSFCCQDPATCDGAGNCVEPPPPPDPDGGGDDADDGDWDGTSVLSIIGGGVVFVLYLWCRCRRLCRCLCPPEDRRVTASSIQRQSGVNSSRQALLSHAQGDGAHVIEYPAFFIEDLNKSDKFFFQASKNYGLYMLTQRRANGRPTFQNVYSPSSWVAFDGHDWMVQAEDVLGQGRGSMQLDGTLMPGKNPSRFKVPNAPAAGATLGKWLQRPSVVCQLLTRAQVNVMADAEKDLAQQSLMLSIGNDMQGQSIEGLSTLSEFQFKVFRPAADSNGRPAWTAMPTTLSPRLFEMFLTDEVKSGLQNMPDSTRGQFLNRLYQELGTGVALTHAAKVFKCMFHFVNGDWYLSLAISGSVKPLILLPGPLPLLRTTFNFMIHWTQPTWRSRDGQLLPGICMRLASEVEKAQDAALQENMTRNAAPSDSSPGPVNTQAETVVQATPVAEPGSAGVQRVNLTSESASALEPQPQTAVEQQPPPAVTVLGVHLETAPAPPPAAATAAAVEQPPPAVTVLLDESREVGSITPEVGPETATLTQLAAAESQSAQGATPRAAAADHMQPGTANAAVDSTNQAPSITEPERVQRANTASESALSLEPQPQVAVEQPPPAVTVLDGQERGLDESREVGSTASEVRPESETLAQLATAESQRVEARDYENASKLYTQSSLIQELRQQIEAKECDEREAVAQRQYAIAEQHDTERRALEGQMAAAIQDAQRLARRAAGEEVALSDDS
jgi:hypothetical protein